MAQATTMTEFAPWAGLAGGLLIGLASVVLLAGIGRIAGVSTILASVFLPGAAGDKAWRVAFIVGLPLGAALVTLAGYKNWNTIALPAGYAGTVAAGLLVGLGTAMGTGCTSGHGICGLARFSQRSLAATLMFMATAGLTVFVIRHVL